MAHKPRVWGLKWQNFLALTLAGIINAFGVTMFLAPVRLFDSGISGTSMLISQYAPPWCSLSLMLVVLNIPIFLLGLRREGKAFTLYSIYAVAVYSVAAWLITDILPVDVTIASPLAQTDLFLCAIFGGMISGVGSGLTVRYGGAIDGIDVLGVLFAKQLGLSLGSFVMAYNVLLYIICGIVLGSWILPLYSIVTYAAASKTVDFCVEGLDRSKAAFIITARPEAVCQALSDAFENGITTLNAKGYYSGTEKTMIYFVLNRFQIGKMKNLVHTQDPQAYIAINDVADIFPATNLGGQNIHETMEKGEKMGKLIVIEGTDGSGKSTQFRLLTQRLEQEQVAFQKLVFPQYSEESSALIRMYLGGEFGDKPSDVNAYAASAFYAVDRYASYKKVWGQWYEQGGLVLSDRYTTSNAVHQASKEPAERRGEFLKWLYEFEYDRLGLPRPDLVIYLDVPTDFTERLLRGREQQTCTKADIHEKDTAYLTVCRETGRAAAKYYGWKVINCVKDGQMRPLEDIHQEIYQAVRACMEG